LFTFQRDSLNKKDVGNDIMILEIGNTSSLFYSQYRKFGDSLMAEDQKRGFTGTDVAANKGKYFLNKWSLVLAKNYPLNKNTASEIAIQPYKYQEEIVSQNWKILNDTMTLYELKCQKAVGRFRGRNYEAWFSRDIPVNNGPWKFFGLPGLIVKVNDDKMEFNFELNGVEVLKNKHAMLFPEKKYITSTRLGLWKIKKDMADDPIGFLENSSGLGLKVTSPMSPQERDSRKKPYNPIELE